MKIETAREETVSNLPTAKKFSITASAKAFQILSSGIYENKKEAIVRELSCNAYDSHVQAGMADTPFVVHLPTMFEPFFSVEDFGVGLSEEEVYNVYTTYFESTKTDSNDVIGALGLGSKSPFSYTDSFTITACKDGTMAVFNASIGSSGEPEVVKMYDRPWVGSNGVKVEVSIAERDTHAFHTAASEVFSWFKVKPSLNKELFYSVSEDVLESLEKYGYHIGEKDSSASRAKVLMGNVAYDLHLADIKFTLGEPLDRFLDHLSRLSSKLYLTVPIGDADVAASRETLSLDERTKENLAKHIDKIRENFKDTVEQKVKTYSTIVEAYNSLTPFERSFVMEVEVGGYTLTQYQKQRHITAAATFNDVEAPSLDMAFYLASSRRGRSGPRIRRDTVIDRSTAFGTANKATVVINNCERKQGFGNALQDTSLTLPANVFAIVDKKSTLTPELKTFLDNTFMNAWEVVYASSFWDGKLSAQRNSSGGLAKEVVKCRHIRAGRTKVGYGRVDFSVEDASKWAYLDFTNSECHRVLGQLCFGADLYTLMRELGLDGVVMCQGNNTSKIKRNVADNLEDLVLSTTSRQDVVNLCLKEASSGLMHLDSRRVLEGWEGFVDSCRRPLPRPKCTELAAYKITTAVERGALMESINGRNKTFSASLEALKRKSKILNKMLQGSLDDATLIELKDYIRLIGKGE